MREPVQERPPKHEQRESEQSERLLGSINLMEGKKALTHRYTGETSID